MSETKEDKIFEALSSKWWDENGPLKMLHLMNPVRIFYIKEYLQPLKSHNIQDTYGKNISNFISQRENNCITRHRKTLLDIGCGGGILSFPLAALGFDVLGIDKTKACIDAANNKLSKHLERNEYTNLKFTQTNLEKLIKKEAKFDIICCMEVLEHVNDVSSMILHISSLLNPGGMMFFSTINRTAASYIKAIVFAEYIMRIVPIGTHLWKKFIKPSEIVLKLEECGFEIINFSGMQFKGDSWVLCSDLSVNYIASARKI